MGDGHVALILDVAGLAQASNAVTRSTRRPQRASAVDAHQGEEKQSLLLFTTDDDTTMALPLSMVARLESFDASQLERSGSRSVVQYRGEILPLIELATHHPGEQAGQERSIPVIVYNEGDHRSAWSSAASWMSSRNTSASIAGPPPRESWAAPSSRAA